MPNWRATSGAIALCLLGQGVAAQGTNTLLNGILGGLAPGSEVTWASGVASAGVETYQDLFFSVGTTRVRAASVRVSPDGPVASIEAQGVVLSRDEDDRFGVEIEHLRLSVSAALINGVSKITLIPDLCLLGRGENRVEAERVRIVQDVGQDPGRSVRSELRIRELSLRQEVSPVGSGCEIRFSLAADEVSEARSDKSGLSLSTLETTFSLPGNVETLTGRAAPDLNLSTRVGGVERQLPGGGAVANMRDGTLTLSAPALGLVPVLTAFLRTRDAGQGVRDTAIAEALLPAEASITASLNGTALLAEAIIPAHLISGISKASLTTVIGDYKAEILVKGGEAKIDLGSSITGVGVTRGEAILRLSAPPENATPIGIWPRLERVMPRADLMGAQLSHRDEGLLRAIELISGSPVSVLAAIYLKDGVLDAPEPWRPALRRAVSELARFSSLTLSRDGARLKVSTAPGISLQEAYTLLSFRPELAGDLILTNVGPAPARVD
jgi:hypothetical protein